MVLRFLSRTVQLARHSSSPLGRPLCSASANKPVLTLFTKLCKANWNKMQAKVYSVNGEDSKHTWKTDLMSRSGHLWTVTFQDGIIIEAQMMGIFCCIFLQKPCPLCDEAKEVLEPHKKRFILQEVDITLPENSSWYDKYKYDIPVFHLNGNFLMKHRVDIQKFEDQLTKLELQNDGNQ